MEDKDKKEEVSGIDKAKEVAGKAASFASEKAGEAKEKWDNAKPETRKKIIKGIVGLVLGLLIICKLRKKK